MPKKKKTDEEIAAETELEESTPVEAASSQDEPAVISDEAPPDEAPPAKIEAETESNSEVPADVTDSGSAVEAEETPPEDATPEVESPFTDVSSVGASVVESGRKSFYELDINKLDRNLSPEEAQEWNSIYASYRSKSILSGVVIGVDENQFEVTDKETGVITVKTISSLIIVNYRAKILIPETEIWMPDDERPLFVARNMVGGTVDYVILEVDREGGCAVASRRLALMSRRYFFGRSEHNEGDRLTCQVVSVGPKLCLVECNGFDKTLIPRELSYSAMPDLREKYKPGMVLGCVLKSFSKDPPELVISVKEAQPNPFDGAENRHPVGSRRQAFISGKYKGGVFCTMPDGTVCHCLYASQHSDINFRIGDAVIISIREFNFTKQQMFGRIVGKC